MKLILKNLLPTRYALDLGPFPAIPGVGTSIRHTLQPNGLPGDTLDIGAQVSLYDLNLSQLMRQMVTPVGSTTVTTSVSGGYTVTATPPGPLSLTVLADANDVTEAVAPGGAGGGGGFIPTMVWVDAVGGSDTGADGTPAKPWQTITAALGSITDASAVKPYTVMLAPGAYAEAVTFPAFVSVFGVSRDSVQLTGMLDLNSASWNVAGAASEVAHLTIVRALDFDWSVQSPPAGVRLAFTDVRFIDAIQVDVADPGNVFSFSYCTLEHGFFVLGGTVFFYETSVQAGGESTALQTAGNTTFTAFGGGATGIDEGNDFVFAGVVTLVGFALAHGQVVVTGVFNSTVEGFTPNASLVGAIAQNLYTSATGLGYLDTNARFADPKPFNVQDAIDRLAAAVAGLLGGGPIP